MGRASYRLRNRRGASVALRSSRGLDRRALRGGLAIAIVLRPLLVVHRNELADARGDFLAETGAAEHAEVADFRLQVVQFPRLWDVDAEFLRRMGLTDAGNVVLLAFDRHQTAVADRRQIDELAAVPHLTLRQRVTNENGFDRLRVI